MVYLAPDPDREGEAIAWHLKEALGLDDAKIHRVTFNEITKKAILEAFAKPGAIDMDLVAAQEAALPDFWIARRGLQAQIARCCVPRSPRELKRRDGGADRWQIRLVIVDREREIQAFKAEEFWKIFALVSPEVTVDAKTIKRKAGRRKTKEG